jgi:hypothetical protein
MELSCLSNGTFQIISRELLIGVSLILLVLLLSTMKVSIRKDPKQERAKKLPPFKEWQRFFEQVAPMVGWQDNNLFSTREQVGAVKPLLELTGFESHIKLDDAMLAAELMRPSIGTHSKCPFVHRKHQRAALHPLLRCNTKNSSKASLAPSLLVY